MHRAAAAIGTAVFAATVPASVIGVLPRWLAQRSDPPPAPAPQRHLGTALCAAGLPLVADAFVRFVRGEPPHRSPRPRNWSSPGRTAGPGTPSTSGWWRPLRGRACGGTAGRSWPTPPTSPAPSTCGSASTRNHGCASASPTATRATSRGSLAGCAYGPAAQPRRAPRRPDRPPRRWRADRRGLRGVLTGRSEPRGGRRAKAILRRPMPGSARCCGDDGLAGSPPAS